MKLAPQFRTLEVGKPDSEKRTVELSFSSEEPYERYWGVEILDHSLTSVDMQRLNNGAPLLFNHDTDAVVGVVESAQIKDGRGIATVRFGNSAKAQEVFRDVEDGILKNVSVGYRINEMKLESEKDGVDTYRVSQWMPYEISVVSVPADNTVGIGRSSKLDEKEIKILKKEVKKMEKEQKQENTVDVAAIQAEARVAETTRVREITAIAEKFGKKDLATAAIDGGMSLDQFRAQVLNSMESPKPIDTKSQGFIGMSEKEVRQFSMTKALRALANPSDRRAQDDAAFEFEVSQEAQRASGVTSQGILVPFDVFKRDLTVSGTSGVTVDTQMGGLIDILRNKSAVMALAEVLSGLNGNISFPRQTTSMTINELTEVEANTPSDITLDEITMSPKRFGGTGGYSKQLLNQSSVAIENLIRNDLMTQIGLKIDSKAVTTILATVGIGLVSLGTDGAALTNGSLIDLETEIAVDNADIGRLAYLINARTRGFAKKTPVVSGNPKMIMEGNFLNGYTTVVSNQIPANLTKGSGTSLSAVLFGNFADLVIGMWGGIDLVVDPYTEARTGRVLITADQFADIAVKRAESFAAIKDAIVA